MYFFHRVPARAGMVCSLLALALGLLSACTPYRVPVVQGNVVTREQVSVLRPGMSRIQVRDILGTPLLASVFHADRWDYVFTLQNQGAEPQARRVTVYFKGSALERFEAEALPSEAEFASSLGRQEKPKVPLLEAPPQKLQEHPRSPAPTAEVRPLPPLPSSYPPLEPASR
jgi:outer membrane protein assembly factor BamE